MKLIFCPACKDLFKLHISRKSKGCMCGLSWGRYHKNGKDAVIGGFAIPVGIDNKSFMLALKKWKSSDGVLYCIEPRPFDAFIIPLLCSTVKKDNR